MVERVPRPFHTGPQKRPVHQAESGQRRLPARVVEQPQGMAACKQLQTENQKPLRFVPRLFFPRGAVT